MVAGDPGADRGADRAPEAGGAPRVHAGEGPIPETEGDLGANPGAYQCKSQTPNLPPLISKNFPVHQHFHSAR